MNKYKTSSDNLRVVIGASGTIFEGWTSTEESELNLLNNEQWEKSFKDKKLYAIVAEHVWEHMTKEEGIVAAKNCYEYLKCGGYIRCAVPDANFRNEWYQNMVKVGGPGQVDHPAASHKIVYDYKTFVEVFEKAGFEVELLEYCDENGDFHYKYWNPDDGVIGRSYRYDTRNSLNQLGMVSIIIDAKKPLVIENKG